jgi:hypothetical protein
MSSEDFDQQEVDRLVRELNERKSPVVPQPAANQASQAAGQPDSVVLQANADAAPGTPVRQVSRWSTVRLLMPAMAAATPRRSFAAVIGLPALPRTLDLPIPQLPELTDETRRLLTVRAWVALGILLSVSMAYWPYPKTYLVGLLAYIFAVAIVVVAGIWSAKLTWDVRLGGAHTVALGIVVWAIGLIATETLHAVGAAF